jgi:hypothetical protein
VSLLQLRDALVATGIPTYHFTASEEESKYIVWLEEGERSYFRTADTHSMWADNQLAEQAISGMINYVTDEEYDSNVDLIQHVFKDIGLSYSLSSIEYNKQLQRIHYKWTFEMAIGESIYGEDNA